MKLTPVSFYRPKNGNKDHTTGCTLQKSLQNKGCASFSEEINIKNKIYSLILFLWCAKLLINPNKNQLTADKNGKKKQKTRRQ